MSELAKNTPRQQVENYFRHVAQKDLNELNQKNNRSPINDLILKNDKKKILYVMPGFMEDCFLSTAVLESLREVYEEENWDIYVSTSQEFKSIFDGNKNITAWIPYSQEMEDHMKMEGIGEHQGWFDICFTPHLSTQRSMNYIHNGINKLLL
jgi:transcription termination factor Rho